MSMIALRRLEMKDIKGMLEWMHDDEIMSCFRMDVASEEKMRAFIERSFSNENRHYAIADEHDEYLGTISLKNIDQKNENAEYAIVLRREAMGMGIAQCATKQLLDIAFCELKLHRVYLNVLSENKRAIQFYEKMKFKFEGEFKQSLKVEDRYVDLSWYAVFKEDYLSAGMWDVNICSIG